MSFRHQHPYQPFIPENCKKLIVGTIPPPRFSGGEIDISDVDFCYGSRFGLLWPILEQVFDCRLDYENTRRAIEQRKQMLVKNRIGICDMLESCTRQRMEASDQGMKDIRLRDLKRILEEHSEMEMLLFMGGNSKNGPEYLFKRHAKENGLKMILKRSESPRINELYFSGRKISCISLISPSSAANRAIGGHNLYKAKRNADRNYTTLDFRIEQYQPFFVI
jgi:G:T/U-mismatch repair DNA glycosylase